jgi:hypothetical protein
VGVLRTVVKVPVLAVLHPRQHLLLRGPVAFELVGDDHPWYVGQSLQQLAEKLLRRLLVSTVLDKNIQDMAILIDGPPEGVPGPIDRQKHLVQVPLIAGSGTLAPELIGIGLPELQAPLLDGFIGHANPPGEQEFFHIPVAQAEAEIEPDAVANDLGREAMECVWIGWCGSIHNSPKAVYRYEERAFLSRGTMVEG